jgi:hypothetical protein
MYIILKHISTDQYELKSYSPDINIVILSAFFFHNKLSIFRYLTFQLPLTQDIKWNKESLEKFT